MLPGEAQRVHRVAPRARANKGDARKLSKTNTSPPGESRLETRSTTSKLAWPNTGAASSEAHNRLKFGDQPCDVRALRALPRDCSRHYTSTGQADHKKHAFSHANQTCGRCRPACARGHSRAVARVETSARVAPRARANKGDARKLSKSTPLPRRRHRRAALGTRSLSGRCLFGNLLSAGNLPCMAGKMGRRHRQPLHWQGCSGERTAAGKSQARNKPGHQARDAIVTPQLTCTPCASTGT